MRSIWEVGCIYYGGDKVSSEIVPGRKEKSVVIQRN